MGFLIQEIGEQLRGIVMHDTTSLNGSLSRKRLGIFVGLMAILACVSVANAETSKPSQPVKIWADGDQFVQLAPQDSAPGSPPPPNEHPVSIDADTIAAALAKITLRQGDERYSLFDARTTRRLAAPLSKALNQASPNQDVLFAVLMWVKGALLGSNDVTVAGRVFFLNGHLHLIIGDLHRSAVAPEFYRYPNASRKIDRRVHPHVPGQRAQETRYDDEARFETMPGLALFEVNGKPRGDWLVVDLAALHDKPPAAAENKPSPTPSSMETPKTTSAPSLEERLKRLKQLREQNLITDDEYARKRKEILDQL